MKKIEIGLGFVIALAFANQSSANIAHQSSTNRGTYGKACPDYNSDSCCESGEGNCLETVTIIAKKK